MSKRSGDSSGQPAMFTFKIDPLAKSLALGDKPRWLYPCGLCNARMVREPGSLCSVCAPTPPRSRRKTATKKAVAKETPAKKGAAKKTDQESTTGRRAAAKRVPPWDRVAGDSTGAGGVS